MPPIPLLFRDAAVAAALAAASGAAVRAQPTRPGPFASGEVTFAMHAAIVGAFSGRAAVVRAEFTGRDLNAVGGFAEVRVADMRTGIDLRDRHLREAMSADSYPTIRFDLLDARPAAGRGAGDTTAITLDGRLTLDGVTRPVHATGTVVTRPGGTDVQATFALDMRDYGIRPPVRALVLRVAPDVIVTARLSFSAGPGP